MIDTYGQKLLELSESVDRVSVFSKMCRELFLALIPSSKVWKTKVTSGKRLLYRLVLSAHRIDAKDFGLLPTPLASEAQKMQRICYPSPSDPNGRSLTQRIGKLLATPTASQAIKPIRNYDRSKRHGHATSEQIAIISPGSIGQKLNPQFLEWMMGYPITWSEIER